MRTSETRMTYQTLQAHVSVRKANEPSLQLQSSAKSMEPGNSTNGCFLLDPPALENADRSDNEYVVDGSL